MNPTPAPRRNQRGKPTRPVGNTAIEMPQLGLWLQQVRVDRGLSQRELAGRANISEGYIPKIEAGLRPGREVLDQLIATLSLSPLQARHTRELWGPPLPLPSIDELRERAATAARIEHLERLDESGVMCIYTDPLWNVLAANQSFYRALPGLEETRDNIPLWVFRRRKNYRPSTEVAPHWDHEAAFHVASLRGPFGLYRDSPRARDLFNQLRQDASFAQLWKETVAVSYARNGDDYVHLRDPSSGELYSITVDIHEVADVREIRVIQAIRRDRPRLATLSENSNSTF